MLADSARSVAGKDVCWRQTLLAAGLVLATLVAAGCGGADAQSVAVRWLLADGRSCLDAAVATVILTPEGSAGDGAPVAQDCPRGAYDDTIITVPAVLPGMRLHGRGLSASDTVLYRGELLLADPVPQKLDMTLDFTGGQ